MKKLLLLALTLGVAGAIAIPALAMTRNRAYTGHAGDPRASGTVGLTLRLRNGVPKRVTRFEFRNIPATCSGFPPTAVTGALSGPMVVGPKRRFHGRSGFNGGRATIVARGTVSKDRRSMNGTLRAYGTVTGCGNADTGSIAWKAKVLSR